jgi:hypothetical protein
MLVNLTVDEIRLLLSLPISQHDGSKWAGIAASAKRKIAKALPEGDATREWWLRNSG